MTKKFWFIIMGLIVIAAGAIIVSFRPKTISTSIPNNPASQICQKIKQQDIKYSCLAQVNNDEKYCDELDSNPKNVCLAVFKKDASFCQDVSQNSRQYCYQNLVSVSGKASFCDQLTDPKEISSCYVHFVGSNYFVSNLSAINPLMCDKVLKDQPEHTLCQAMTTQNAAFCDPDRVDCPAYITKDLALCPKSASKTDEAECYHALAMLNKNSTTCEKIDAAEAKDDCYRDYSRLIKDEQFCNQIFNSNPKDQCLRNIAVNISKQS